MSSENEAAVKIVANADGVEPVLESVKAQIKELAASARESAEMMTEMREAVMGFGEVFLAAFAVEELHEFAEKMGEMAEHTAHLSQQLGLTIAQTQALSGAATAAGVPFDALVKGLGVLDLHLAKEPKLFTDLGIEIPKNATQMQALNAVMDKFRGTEAGPEKTALAMMLMGRAGKELIPFLNEGSKGLEELTEKSVKYGVVNEDAAATGLALAESLNEGKLAMAGLKETLTGAFGPVLTELSDGFNHMVAAMTESYRQGGLMKVVFDTLSTLFRDVVSVVEFLGTSFAEVFTVTGAKGADWSALFKGILDGIEVAIKAVIAAVTILASGFKVGFEEMVGYGIQWYGKLTQFFETTGLAIEALRRTLQTFGVVAADALTLRWGQIASDWDAGMAQIQKMVEKRGKEIVAQAKATAEESKKWLATAAGDNTSLDDYVAHLDDKDKPAAKTGIKEHEGGTGGAGDLADAGKNKKAPKAKSRTSDWEEKLEEAKLAWSQLQDAQGQAQAYSLESESAYWKAILDRDDLSTEERLAVTKSYLAAHSQLTKQAIDQRLADYKKEIDGAKGNLAVQQQIAAEELAYVGKMYGTQSTQYKAMQDKIVDMDHAAAEEHKRIADDLAQHIEKMQQIAISERQQAASFLVEMGVKTNAELLRDQVKFENDSWQASRAALQAKLAAERVGSEQWQKLQSQQDELDKQHEAKRTDLAQKAMLQRTAIERQGINSVASSWGQTFGKLVTLQQGFATSIKQLWQGLQSAIGDALASIAEQWLINHISKLVLGATASKSAGAGEISTAAAIAGANGVASMALAPFPMDTTAPAFGGAMAAAAAGFGSLLTVPSLSGGSLRTAEGLTMIHEDEAVIPAWGAEGLRNMISAFATGFRLPTFEPMPQFSLPAGLASPLRSMINTPVANNNAAAPANSNGNGSGDTFIIHAMDSKSLHSYLQANHGAVGDAVRKNVRNGGKTS